MTDLEGFFEIASDDQVIFVLSRLLLLLPFVLFFLDSLLGLLPLMSRQLTKLIRQFPKTILHRLNLRGETQLAARRTPFQSLRSLWQ